MVPDLAEIITIILHQKLMLEMVFISSVICHGLNNTVYVVEFYLTPVGTNL